MDLDALGKPKHSFFREVGLHSRNEVIQLGLWDTEVGPCGVCQTLTLGQVGFRVPNVSVDDRAVLCLAILAQNMLKLVTKYKPEVVDTIKPQRHANYWRIAVQPEASTVHLRPHQRLDKDQPYASFCKDARDVANLF